jgi:hypothetical protein
MLSSGAGSSIPNRKVRIACLRTNRMLMYRIADPGAGIQVREHSPQRAIAPG